MPIAKVSSEGPDVTRDKAQHVVQSIPKWSWLSLWILAWLEVRLVGENTASPHSGHLVHDLWPLAMKPNRIIVQVTYTVLLFLNRNDLHCLWWKVCHSTKATFPQFWDTRFCTLQHPGSQNELADTVKINMSDTREVARRNCRFLVMGRFTRVFQNKDVFQSQEMLKLLLQWRETLWPLSSFKGSQWAPCRMQSIKETERDSKWRVLHRADPGALLQEGHDCLATSRAPPNTRRR